MEYLVNELQDYYRHDTEGWINIGGKRYEDTINLYSTVGFFVCEFGGQNIHVPILNSQFSICLYLSFFTFIWNKDNNNT